VNGAEVEFYKPNLDLPKQISLHSPYDKYDKYHIGLGFHIDRKKEFTYTIVQWNEQDRDTFKVKYERGEGYLFAMKCWVNGELVWDVNKRQERFFTLIK